MKKRIASVLLLVFVLIATISVLAACNEGDTRSDAAPEPTPVDYFTFEPNSARDGYILTGTQKILPANVVIPSEYMGLPVTEIGKGAFEGCAEIESVVVPSPISSIRPFAFAYCSSLNKADFSCVSVLSDHVFYHCESLKTVNWGNAMELVGENCFEECGALESVDLPSTVWGIGEECFKNCEHLKEIKLPNSLRSIPTRSFYGCENLKQVTIAEGVTSIYVEAFAFCSSLQQIVLPDSLILIATTQATWMEGAETVWANRSETSDSYSQIIKAALVEGEAKSYQEMVEETSESYSVFPGCSSLSDISVPAATYIAVGAFSGASPSVNITRR